MADDVQEEATHSSDGQDHHGKASTEQSTASTTKTDEEPYDEDAPSKYLQLDAKRVQYITQIWKIDHQHVGVQQTGTVHGGQAYGIGTTTDPAERASPDHDGQLCGKIRSSDLARIRVVHVPAHPAHKYAKKILDEHGAVILHGRARWGKTTTALRLLDEKHPDEVYLLDSESPFPAIKESLLKPGKGYLIEHLTPDTASAINPVALMHLSERLVGLNSHVVVTIDGLVPLRSHALAWALVVCDELPDAKEMLKRNVAWRLHDKAYSVDELMQPQWVLDEIAAQPHPVRVDALASVLESIASNDLDATHGPAAYWNLLPNQVGEWFETHPGLRERCLMVAIAVLNKASYQEVADAADRLHDLLEPPSEDEDEDEDEDAHPQGPGWEMSSPRRHRVQDCCADLVSEFEPTLIGDLPVERVHFEDQHLQRVVLEHVWTEHDVVRSKLLTWLEELGADSSQDVRVLAAAAVGSLAHRDFRYFHDRLIRAWAAHDDRDVRLSAAIALDVLAAAGEDSAPRVRRLLRRWIRLDASSAMAWTAVATYGFELGRRAPEAALDDVLTVVLHNPRALWITGKTIANFCDFGLARIALARLRYWSEQHRIPFLRERTLRVFLHATSVDRVGEIGAPELPRSGPVLLWVAGADSDLRANIAELWEGALGDGQLEQSAAEALHRWFNQARDDPKLEPALTNMVTALLQRSRRTQAVVRRLLTDWAEDPLRPSAAAARYLRYATEVIR